MMIKQLFIRYWQVSDDMNCLFSGTVEGFAKDGLRTAMRQIRFRIELQSSSLGNFPVATIFSIACPASCSSGEKVVSITSAGGRRYRRD